MFGNTTNDGASVAEVLNQFSASLGVGKSDADRRSWVTSMTDRDRSVVFGTIENVCSFINDHQLYPGGSPVATDIGQLMTTSGNESLINTSVNLQSQLSSSSVLELCTACGIKDPSQKQAAAMAVVNLLLKMRSVSNNGGMFRENHFGNIADSVAGKAMSLSDLRSMLPRTLHSTVFDQSTYGNEAFGAETDRVLPDIRVSMAVTLLRFHRGLLDRIIHRRTSSSTVINYTIPYAEVYDLMKSMDNSGQVRNSSDHRIPFLNLYADPKVVSNTLRPIVPLAVNDVAGSFVARDSVLKFNTMDGNLMDLAKVAGQIGMAHTDYTDLIADGVVIDKFFFKLTATVNVAGTPTAMTEEFMLPLRTYSKSRLQMEANTTDSANRVTNLYQQFKLTKNLKTTSGADSRILAGVEPTDCLELRTQMSIGVNLKFHTFWSSATASITPYTTNASGAVAANITDLLNAAGGKLSMALVGFSLDAKYSEENLRKTNIAIRSHYRTMGWEIPVGRNFVVDYALNEALPEYVMANVTEAISLGQDHKALNIIMQVLADVHDRGVDENSDPNFRDDIYKLGFDYVASQQVRPVVYLGQIDLADVDTMRSSDILGDIRQFVELKLVNIISLLHQNSYYKTQLNPGEKPLYKVITSNIILENLLNIPHIHNHLQASGHDSAGDEIEYRRVLPSGTVLECVSTAFDYMRDKVLIIPYRAGDPESILNAAHNWDYGTFLANYSPQFETRVNRRVFANAREMPLPTNPIGVVLSVKNISTITDMFQLINSKGTTGQDIPDFASRMEDTSALTGPENLKW